VGVYRRQWLAARHRLRVLVTGFAFTALAASAWAQALSATPSEILTNPDRFDRQPVIVTGIISNLRERVSLAGNPYYTLDLSDGKQAVRVFSFGKAPCRSGRGHGRRDLRENETAEPLHVLQRGHGDQGDVSLGAQLDALALPPSPERRGLHEPMSCSSPASSCATSAIRSLTRRMCHWRNCRRPLCLPSVIFNSSS